MLYCVTAALVVQTDDLEDFYTGVKGDPALAFLHQELGVGARVEPLPYIPRFRTWLQVQVLTHPRLVPLPFLGLAGFPMFAPVLLQGTVSRARFLKSLCATLFYHLH